MLSSVEIGTELGLTNASTDWIPQYLSSPGNCFRLFILKAGNQAGDFKFTRVQQERK